MKDPAIFFTNWESILRVIVVGTLGYVSLIALLRASGKRTLASMNAFDFVVTVAVGSSFGRVLTARGTPLADAVTAFALLVVLQYAVSWGRTRFPRFGEIVTGKPTLLWFRGSYLPHAMRRQRVSEVEVQSAIRQKRLGGFDEVEAVVMETGGTLSVIPRADVGDASVLPAEDDIDQRDPSKP